MNEIELATLTGFFAGEGNITVSGGKWPTLYAALGNTERFWVEKFYKEFGGAFYVEAPKYKGAKFMFRWRVCGKKAVKFLQSIEPYLIGEKAEQLRVGLRFQKLKAEGHCLNRPYTPQQILEMNKEREAMRTVRRAAAETNRKDALPWRSDSPTLEVIPVS